MFSHWTEAFPCRQANASGVAKILLEIIPTWGIPLKLHSDRGTHFTCQVLKQVCAIWPLLHFHYAYHPRSSGLIQRTNGIIKTQVAKCVETLQTPWPKAEPLVLLNLRSTPLGLTSFHLSR